MPKHLKHFTKVKVTCYAWGPFGMNQDWTINHVRGWTVYAPCMSSSPYLLPPHWKSCAWMCLSHICIMSTLPALTCLINKWCMSGYRTRAVLGLPSNLCSWGTERGAWRVDIVLLCCFPQIHQVNLWRHKCDYHLRRDLVKKTHNNTP